MSMKTFAPKEVICTLGGIPIGGFEEGTFITISKADDNWTAKSGINGDAIRILKTAFIYNVEFTLMFTSDSNDYLSALATADANIPGTGLVPLTINNGLGRDLFASDQAWIVKPADTVYSDAADPKVWTLMAYNPNYFVAGS